MRVLVIDNYDSFTYNLVHLIGALGPEIEVVRNDKIAVEDIKGRAPDAIVISPGPGTPDDAGICLDTIRTCHAETPIFGVCLGMQSIGQVFGGHVVLAPNMMHGKTSKVTHTGRGVFRGLNAEITATRYHSLVVDQGTLPSTLEVTATADDDGTIMGLQHTSFPVHGVQFHPESIASEAGDALLRNFLTVVNDFHLGRAA